jgi:transposase
MYIGVDTHKAQHVLAALDTQGRLVGTQRIANTPEGWAGALAWAGALDPACVWGIENSGSLGKGFAQAVLVGGETAVYEISPHRTAQ